MGMIILWVLGAMCVFFGIVIACVIVVTGQYVQARIRKEFLVATCLGAILFTGIAFRKIILISPGREYLLVSLYAAFLGGFVYKINQTNWS